ncbi:MAG TPA: hypothetical protein DDY88_03725 [Actinobacteria bacterium]|nr:hypothetical protein [Actinomycetota bacterium]
MASVTLLTVWINLASDLSDYRSFSMLSSLRVVKDKPGSVNTYASGRRRLVLKAGGGYSIDLTLPQLTRDEIDWLDLHVGDLVLVRDDRGRKIWCTYLSLPIDEDGSDIAYGDGSLSLVEITHSEIV